MAVFLQYINSANLHVEKYIRTFFERCLSKPLQIAKMQILTLNFFIFTIGGVWRPLEWSSSSVKFLYDSLGLFVVVSNYFLTLTQFLDIVLVVDNMDDFITNSLLFVTVLAVCFKVTVIVRRRKAIIDLVQTLLKEPCKPRNKEEETIQKKFDQFIR